jgi:sugar phosphate permease
VTQVGVLGSLFVAMVIVGRTGIGVLLDALHPPLVAFGAMLCAALGALLFLYAEGSFPAYVTIVCLLGVALGSVGDIEAFFVARQFGLKAYGAIFGSVAMCTAGSIGAGAYLFAWLHGLNHRYDEAFIVSAVMFVVSGLLFGSLPGRSRPEPVAPVVGGQVEA